MISGALITLIVVVIVAIILLFMSVKTVPQGMHFTVEYFGRFDRVLTPGLRFLLPFAEQIGARVNMQESVLDIPSQKVITKDNAIVTVDAVAFYQVIDAAKAAYEVQNLHLAIVNLAITNIRNVMGSMALDDVLSKRNEINDTLLAIIDQATHAWGVKVLRIELKDIIPPEDMVQAMARQMKAEREKRAQILEAEGFREAAIKKAEGEKQSAILVAEGQREAAFRAAEARERAAEAEARATNVVSTAISSHGVQAINYFLGLKYVEALSAIGGADNSKVFFLPMDATGIMGAIGGLAELTREGRSAPTPTAPGGGGGGISRPSVPSMPPSGPWRQG
jgi:regulator of protease activity HflC (stomatin/prohibitin superfamily)